MGEYEDRYPDAYGRDEVPTDAPREEVIRPAQIPPQRGREAAPLTGLSDVRGPEDWQHAPNVPAAGPGAAVVEPTAEARRWRSGTYRGMGPRGYTRPPQRIYEDICDRLTENPFIDASDIEVRVSGREVTLTGSVDSTIAMRQAEEIAEEVAGVSHVSNRLAIHSSEERGPTPGDQVNRAMGSNPAR